ncbi:hypothetical protein [Clostridium estertheticum]|uniref:hypothetical protein n=1 Tax=Clostridium estertheticum TaxID=238834 RepID=UPI001CF5D114|nr:hypothetical protein [Clostridium estertheticum]MCB2360295.1 hypothetical protein [Clostridium estertheticum]
MSHESIEKRYDVKLNISKLKMENIKHNNVNKLVAGKFILTYDEKAFRQAKKEHDLLKLEYLKWKCEYDNTLKEVQDAWIVVLNDLQKDIEIEKGQRPVKTIVRDENDGFQNEWIQDKMKIEELVNIYEDENMMYEKWQLKNKI